MPVLPPDTKQHMRELFLRDIHNLTVRVRKITGEVTANNHPAYKSDAVPVLEIFTGFKCSFYHILSGKVNRVFKERDPADFLPQFGILSEDVYCVDFVQGQTVAKEANSDITMNGDLLENEEVELNGKWWKVRKVIPDSEGVQTQVLCVK